MLGLRSHSVTGIPSLLNIGRKETQNPGDGGREEERMVKVHGRERGASGKRTCTITCHNLPYQEITHQTHPRGRLKHRRFPLQHQHLMQTIETHL
jgi:hypothetical protein